MLHSYSDLTPEKAALACGFADPAAATLLLQDLAGHDISDERFEGLLPALAAGLKATGDPDRALRNFSHWLETVGNRSSYFRVLTNHPAALNALLTIFSISQFFSQLLARYPEHFEVVINPLIRDAERRLDDYVAAADLRMAVAKTPIGKQDALRRFKPPEILRIGARDILGVIGTEEVAREISDFAEACVRSAVKIAGGDKSFAVIALGKLGGRELNYASDIDLVYVHGDEMPHERAVAIGEEVTHALSRSTGAGFLFRVDLRLRPEGRFGPISRSVSSCRAYYESWAEPWERQALLKARWVAGDETVGDAFLAVAEPFAYRRTVDESFVDAIRRNKQAIERKTQRAGEAHSNVKEGIGGIRDVEFIVQMLQLVAGGMLPEVRTGSTMEALRKLSAAGLLRESDCAELGESYLFLRNLEHRLQIMDERPIRNLPLGDHGSLTRFARRLGYPGPDEFLADYKRHAERTRERLLRLFYGQPNRSVSYGSGESTQVVIADWVRDPADKSRRAAVAALLSARGFKDPEEAVRRVEIEVTGSEYGEPHPEATERMALLAPQLFEACAQSGYPDDALKGLDLLASAAPSPGAFFLGLLENPDLLKRLARLAGGAPGLWRTLVEHPELLDRLADEEMLTTPSTIRPPGSKRPATPRQTAAFLRRESLRIAALDLWGLATSEDLMLMMTGAAESALLAALDSVLRERGYSGLADPSAPIPALIALGKLGGRELSYSSDWDVLWIAPGDTDDAAAGVRQIAEQTMEFLNERVKALGIKVEVDARLRPEGRFGTLARTLSDYVRYFESSADAWERQVLIKARQVGGDLRLGQRFLDAAAKIVYDSPLDEDAIANIRHLKARIERERARSAHDIKLGPGGLSDIEWTVQVLQWRFGRRWPQVQTPNTLLALMALRDAAAVRQDDWEILSTTYIDLYTLRNRVWLRDDHADEIPAELAPPGLAEKRNQVREIFERLFLRET